MNKILNVDMDVNDLVTFVFIKNVNDATLNLSLDGIEDTYDFFCFCVDLLCKGLVLLYGSNGSVEIDNLGIEKFGYITKKLNNAGIHVSLDLLDTDDLEYFNTECKVVSFVRPDESKKDDLEAYAMYIRGKSKIYKVKFRLYHNQKNGCNAIVQR